MAKRTRARKRAHTAKPPALKKPRRPCKALPSRRVPAHRTYTPELLANGRRRYEQTDESVASIAADFGIHHYSLIRLAEREGWLRHQRPPRDLPASARLLAQAEALEAEAEALTSNRHPEVAAQRPSQDDSQGLTKLGGASFEARALDGALASQDDGASQSEAVPPLGEAIGRLYRSVLEELAAVETLRAELGKMPRKSLDAARTAQTLSNLTEILRKLQRLQCAQPQSPQSPQSGSDYDDMPADLDEFRNELARRIRAFFAARRGGGDAGGDAAAPVAAGD